MKIQIGTEVRDMTEQELADHAKVFEDLAIIETAKNDANNARKIPLRKLGLTDDEISVVLGL